MRVKNVKRFSAVLIVILAGAGCATKPVSYLDAEPVPPKRIYEAYQEYATADATRARVTLTRDRGMVGAAGSLALYFNGDLVARLRTKESIDLYTSERENHIAIGPGGLTDSNAGTGPLGAGLSEYVLVAEPGNRYFFRIGIDMGAGSLIIERTE